MLFTARAAPLEKQKTQIGGDNAEWKTGRRPAWRGIKEGALIWGGIKEGAQFWGEWGLRHLKEA